ncbi:hypothetical protein GCM10023169_14190 [Georgenia halophila]|uniref:Restriction endonuclease type II-like domain-containing protein n=1 Tax=Georgenia halophila TaxID=620889 RepID=A0ABP8L2B2_9MICO
MPQERTEVVDQAATAWRERLVELGGASTLADLTLLGDAVIDLTAAHPSGIAQLYAGRTTRLSNLVREGGAQHDARRNARTVRARADELAQRYGLAPTYLAIGVATWTELPDPDEPDLTETGEVFLEPSTNPGNAHADNAATSAASAGPTADATSAASAGSAGSPAEPADEATTAEVPPPPPSAPSPAPAPQLAPAGQAPRTPVRTIHAPVLLRPVRLTPHPGADSDFALDLEATIEVNPVLLRALRSAGVTTDVAAIARSAYTEHGFSPRGALTRLAELGSQHLAGFEMTERLVVGPFVHPGQVLVDDLDAMRPYLPGSDVVAALAGEEDARAALDVPLPPHVPTDRLPEEERGVGDLDVDQAHAVDAVTTGRHVFFDAPPGADVLGTVAAVVADAAASGRTAMYVPGSRRSGRALRNRLSEAGLDELVLDLSTDDQWRRSAPQRLRAGLDPAPVEVDDDSVQTVRSELTAVRDELAGYIGGLHEKHQPWNVSAYDALQELARLTSARPGPRTRVRLDAATLEAMAVTGPDELGELLTRASALGAFTMRPHDTPWYGARLTDAASASNALERTQRLGELSLPALLEQVSRVTSQTGLERATTLDEWSEQLRMLDGVAEALDVFMPQIFERSAADMVVATASRRWRRDNGVAMKGGVRRRMRKQAKDLLRPGRPVDDLHAELLRVQEQREIWRRHNPAGGWPRLPDGLAEIKATEAEVRADVEALQPIIGAGAGLDDLTGLALPTLQERMKELGQDAPTLRLLPERTQVLGDLRSKGLGALLEDLATRRVPTALVGAELELAWWSSVLEQILRTAPGLAGQDGPALQRLAGRFRELDEAQVESLAGPVRRAAADAVRAAVRARREDSTRLYRALGDPTGANLRELLAAHPGPAMAARPVWLIAPMLVPQVVPEGPTIDLLLLDGVQHLPVEQAVSLLARARQVVLIGDSRRRGEGLIGTLAPLLPAVTLPTGRAERDEGIAAFLAGHGYDGVIRSVPAPPSASRMRLDLVEGYGMPAPGRDAVESVQPEVDHVVDLVIEHALTSPEQSLAVVALNARHAERVREAVGTAVAGSPAVADFFRTDREEPFTVAEIDSAGGLRRDVVVLSVGFGKTPHGRVLHRFGVISEPDGLACLVDALDAVRHRLVLVSCIGPGDLDRSRLRQPGPQLLADLIEQSATGDLPAQGADSAPEESPDQLLVDLAERLWRVGLTVVPRYGVEGGVRIPLAIGHPDLPGELLVAVLTDDAEYVAEQSLRRRDRHWVQRLADRGWRVHMAFSAAVFMDPQAEAQAILAEVLEVVAERQTAMASARPSAAEMTALPHTYTSADSADAAASPAEPVAPDAGGSPAEAGSTDQAASSAEAPPPAADQNEAPGTDEEPAANEPKLRPRGPRPHVVPGLPLAAYSDDQLDDLVSWIESDGAGRDEVELVEELRGELALTRRGAQVDAVLGHVVRRRG